LAGVIVGLETSPPIMARFGGLLTFLDQIVLIVFVVEAILKIGSFSPRPWRYFQDPWNLFDFSVIALCILPIGGSYASVLRLVRTLRLLRLLTALPKLQLIVGALLKSIPSIGYVGLLLGLHFYIYSVLGVFIFGANDPIHFSSLGKSMLTLFQVLTLEGWADIMRIQIYGCADFGYEAFPQLCASSSASPIAATIFFVTFIIIGTMIILNLFIGVIMNGMQELQKENERATASSLDVSASTDAIDAAIAELHRVKDVILRQRKN
jgi:voltage-gated sodium channel